MRTRIIDNQGGSPIEPATEGILSDVLDKLQDIEDVLKDIKELLSETP